MIRAILAPAALAALVSACTSGAEPDRLDLTPLLERAEAFDVAGVRDALGALGGTVERESRPVQNPYDETSTDSVRVERLGGVTARFYWVASSGQELIEGVVVSGPRVDAGLGFRVGDGWDVVRGVMGEPGREEPDRWSWDLYQGPDDPTPTALTVRFDRDGRVTEIRWEYYLG